MYHTQHKLFMLSFHLLNDDDDQNLFTAC